MDLAFLKRGHVHIVAVQVGEIGVNVLRSGEGLSLEGDSAQREGAARSVHDAIAVVDKDVAQVISATWGEEQAGAFPYSTVPKIFEPKPWKFCTRTERIVMGLGQDGITLGDAACNTLDELAADAGIVNKGKDVNIKPLLVRCIEIVTALDIERVEVAYFDDGLFGGFSSDGTTQTEGRGCLEEEMTGKFLRGYGHKTLQIVERHGNVNVVVPRNEPAVTHGAEKGAAVEPIADVVLLADMVNLFKDRELLELALAQHSLLVVSQKFIFHREW